MDQLGEGYTVTGWESVGERDDDNTLPPKQLPGLSNATVTEVSVVGHDTGSVWVSVGNGATTGAPPSVSPTPPQTTHC